MIRTPATLTRKPIMHAPLKFAAATMAIAALALTSLVATPQPAQAATTSVGVFFDLSRTTLSGGRDAGGERLTTVSSVVAAPASNQRAFTFTSTNSFGARDNTLWERSVVYQLETLGKTTGYWVAIVMAVSHQGWNARCDVYAGDPGTPKPRRATEWNCDSDSRDWRTGSTARISISQNRDAEASGTLKTEGPLSLTDGLYDFNGGGYAKPGAEKLDQNSKTDFAVVLREGDTTYTSNRLGRVRFSYRILEDGLETPFWVVGWSQTDRDTIFKHQAMCFVTSEKPGSGGKLLDDLNREEVTPFNCQIATEKTVGGDNGTYHTDLILAKRPELVVTNPADAAQLINTYCLADPSPNCNVSFASASSFRKTVDTRDLEGGALKYTYSNNTGQKFPVKFSVATKSTVTHTFGTKVSLSAEGNVLGSKISTAIETTYGISSELTREYSQEFSFDLEPYQRKWAVVSIWMVKADGAVLIFSPKDGRNYRLPNVHVELPDKSKPSDWGLEEEWLPRPPSSSAPAEPAG